MVFQKRSGYHEIEFLYEGDNAPCMMRITNTHHGIVVCDDVWPNARMMSAQLRDTLGLHDAIWTLDNLCISPTSDLWDLNHSRPHPRLSEIKGRFDFHDDANRPGDEYRLVGEAAWSQMESGGAYFLYERISDLTLWRSGAIALGGECEPYDEDLRPYRYSAWVELTKEVDEWNDSIGGP